MATSRLKIYNGALLLLGELRLNTITEDREARYLLDEVWNDDGVRYCLEQAQWYFAMRSTRLDFNAGIEPAWGYKRAFDKPTDWVSTSGMFVDGFLKEPLLEYVDEAGFFYSDREELFLRYISDDSTFGLDFARWPSAFTDYTKTYFASRVVHKIPSAAAKIEFLLGPPGREDKGYLNRTLLVAKNKAAMTQPTTFPFSGFWTRARHAGANRPYRDGGSISNLIG
jgi:hypothetical protein